MMAIVGHCCALVITLLALVSIVEGGVLFSALSRSLVVTSRILSTAGSPSDIARAGEDELAVQWSLNSTFAGVDAMYSKVDIKLCFAPQSQVGRGWRKTENDLHRDETCSAADIASHEYTASGNSTTWTVAKKVPKAIYFVRAYAVDANGVELGFGQTTDNSKTTNLFAVEPISGRLTSIDIAAAVFSVFAVGSLVGFLGIETVVSKRKASK